jgi:thiamine-phosphate pyrophosphorylase
VPLSPAARRPIVCLVTNGPDHRPLKDIIIEAAFAGVDLVQIREPSLSDGALISLARQVIQATTRTACRILVNDRFDVALAADGAGVHLRSSSYPAARLREVTPASFLIGRSVHSTREASGVAAAGGCDYVMFGTVFPSASKPAGHTPAGVDALREVCAAVTLPVLAIGGISLENARAAIEAGACGVAAIGLFRGSRATAAIVSALRRQIDT